MHISRKRLAVIIPIAFGAIFTPQVFFGYLVYFCLYWIFKRSRSQLMLSFMWIWGVIVMVFVVSSVLKQIF